MSTKTNKISSKSIIKKIVNIVLVAAVFLIIKLLLLPPWYELNKNRINPPEEIKVNNSSFESWVKSPDGQLLPQYFYFKNSDALIESSNTAKDGKYSALLKQAPAGLTGSYLRYQVVDFDKYKGKKIRLSAWIKSEQESSAAIAVDIQDGINPVNVRTYPNNREWKEIELIGKIDKNAKVLLLTFNPLNAENAVCVDSVFLQTVSVVEALRFSSNFIAIASVLFLIIFYLTYLNRKYFFNLMKIFFKYLSNQISKIVGILSKVHLPWYLKELPIIVFFVYFFYLCVIFHSKTPTMADFLVTFDNLWFFFHQIREGVFPQWNPFSLLGRVASNWNQIPVSIFTPVFLFGDFSLLSYKVINICGTFVLFAALYASGRIAGYGRFFPLIPLLIFLSPGRYTSIASMFIFFNQLTILPLALVYFVSNAARTNNIPFQKGLLALMLLALSFVGVRFENIVHAFGVIILLFAFMGFSQLKKPHNAMNILFWGFAAMGFIIVANIWQFSVLLNVIFTNFRISIQFKPSLLSDSLFWKWIFKGLLYQAPLVLFCGNVFLWRLVKLCRKGFLEKRMPFLLIVAVVIGEFFLVRAMYFFEIVGFNFTWLGASDGTPILNTILRFELYGVVISTIAIAFFRIFLKKPFTIGESLIQIAYFWAGAYIAQITNIFWHGVYPALPLWLGAVLYIFLPLGCYRFAAVRKRAWLVWAVFAYLFLGETGVFFLNEVIGIPWFSIRANVYLAPLVGILTLEGMLCAVKSLIYFPQKLSPVLREIKFSRIVYIAAGAFVLITALLTVRPVFLPVANGAYLGLWPYSTTSIEEVEKNIANPNAYEKSAIDEAYKNSLAVRSKEINRFKRIDPAVTILPSFSQRYNFSYLYNNDISKDLVHMFPECYNESLTIHPEHLFQQHYLQYKKAEAERKNAPLNKDYTGTATLTIDKNKNKLYPELLALEQANARRIFISDRIAQFANHKEEYLYLKNITEKDLLLSATITTSDPSFKPKVTGVDLAKLEYDIEIKEDDPERIKLDVFSNKDAYLVMLDLYHTGWKAFVDNKEVKIFKAYIGTRGIALPAGKHTVIFRFSIPYFIPSLFVSAFAWACLLAGCAVYKKRNRLKFRT